MKHHWAHLYIAAPIIYIYECKDTKTTFLLFDVQKRRRREADNYIYFG